MKKARKIKDLTIVERTNNSCDVYLTRFGDTCHVGYFNKSLDLIPKDIEVAEKEIVMGYRFAPFVDYTKLYNEHNRKYNRDKKVELIEVQDTGTRNFTIKMYNGRNEIKSEHCPHWYGLTITEIEHLAMGIVVGLKQKYKRTRVEIYENEKLIRTQY